MLLYALKRNVTNKTNTVAMSMGLESIVKKTFKNIS